VCKQLIGSLTNRSVACRLFSFRRTLRFRNDLPASRQRILEDAEATGSVRMDRENLEFSNGLLLLVLLVPVHRKLLIF